MKITIDLKTNIINKFSILRDINYVLGNRFKANAYRVAINKIKDIDYLKSPLSSNIIKKLKTDRVLSNKLIDKIIELDKTGEIQDVNELLKQQKDIKELIGIKGIGISTIKKLNKLNIRTLDELKDKSNYNKLNKNPIIKLTKQQLVGIKYKDDLKKRIPRNEVKAISEYIISYLEKKLNKKLDYTIVGSYRRNTKTSGDIDLLILENSNEQLINKITPLIEDNKLVKEIIVEGNKRIIFLIKSKLSSIIRKVDIWVYNKKIYPSVLLYLTGSALFNEKMRGLAKRKNMLLSEYGLIKNKKKLLIEKEEDIFNKLDIKYVKPEDRSL